MTEDCFDFFKEMYSRNLTNVKFETSIDGAMTGACSPEYFRQLVDEVKELRHQNLILRLNLKDLSNNWANYTNKANANMDRMKAVIDAARRFKDMACFEGDPIDQLQQALKAYDEGCV